jgi:hypothetical protein
MASRTPKRRPGASFVDKLTARVGVAEVARRMGVTERTVQRWGKEGPPEARKDAVAGAWRRSEGARKAAEVRAEPWYRGRERQGERSRKQEREPRPRAPREKPQGPRGERGRAPPRTPRAPRAPKGSIPKGWEVLQTPSEIAFDRALDLARKGRIRQQFGPGAEDENVVDITSPREMARRRLLQVFQGREELDRIVSEIADEGELTSRELYSMFFSPEVA